MSRSRRKTPIFGHAMSVSESEDKKIWHRRMRSAERSRLVKSISRDPEAHVTTSEKQVSNPWDMSKDGKYYWPEKSQCEAAIIMARLKTSNKHEAKKIEVRYKKKIMSK